LEGICVLFFGLAKASVYPTGAIVWEPPMIYKSSCPINVQYFPFGKEIIGEF
jgi:nicotinic acetylcholine receptor